MENETQEQEVAQAKQTSVLHQVTPLSKYLAMGLFIILPFLGGYIGYSFAPEKVVEVEKEVFTENESLKIERIQGSGADQCIVDSDCMLVESDCEDCKFAAIGEMELEDFRLEKKNRCEQNPPEVMCDMVFNGEVRCIENKCQIVEQASITKEEVHQEYATTLNGDPGLRGLWNAQNKEVLYTHPTNEQQYFVVPPERGNHLPFTTYIFNPETDSVVELGPSPINKTSDISPDKSSYVSVSKDGKILYVFDLLEQETITVEAEPNETFYAVSPCELSHPSIKVQWMAEGVEYGVFSYPSVPDADWCQTYDLVEIREL